MEYTDGARARATVRSEFESEVHSDRIDSANIRELYRRQWEEYHRRCSQLCQHTAVTHRSDRAERASLLFLSGHPHPDLRLTGVPARNAESTPKTALVLGSAQIASTDRFSEQPDRLKAETRTRKDTYERRARLRHGRTNGRRGAGTGG